MKLLQRPELLAQLVDRMQDGLSVIDRDGVQIYVNDALCKMLGFTREELIGARRPFPYWAPQELPAIEAAFERTVSGDPASCELIFRRKDDSRLEVIIAPSVLSDESGAPVAYFATIKDITERKALERAAHASEQRWRSIAENPFDFVVEIGPDHRYTYVNHTAPGISHESLIGKATPFDYVDPKHHDAMRAAYETTFATGRATSYEVYSPQTKDWYSSIVGAVIQQGRVVAISILTREITAQKVAEESLRESAERLRDAHRLETIGTLASGIAHDINNVLTPILTYAELVRRDLPAGHAAAEYVEGISEAGERARLLVRRILLFSRKREPTRTTFDLSDGVRDDVRLLRASLPASIELVTRLPAEPVLVLADRVQLGQVLTNLATNAQSAMGERGGRLTITLERSATHATLTVADTGPGMDADTARRAFEPFFTTKAAGAGTGLGLSIIERVVREHGGEVTVRSAPGEGATFTVRIPLTSEAGIVSHASQASRAPQTRGLKVLVVDDEPSVAMVTGQALRSAGHVVTVLTSPHEALALLARDPAAIDLLLTDQSMPRMMGTALIAEARALRPTMPCLLMTGVDDDATREKARAVGVYEMIAKPFSMTSLLEVIERARCPAGRTKA